MGSPLLSTEKDRELLETGVVAQGLAKATKLLSQSYDWVVTNVPYLSGGKQSETLKNYCDTYYKDSKSDLATVFLERCLTLTKPKKESQLCGTVSLVLPQNWLFLTSYKKLRVKLLKQVEWNAVVKLGPGAFETISGEVVKAILLQMTNQTPTTTFMGEGTASNHFLSGIDVSNEKSPLEKAEGLKQGSVVQVEQSKQLVNKDCRVNFELKLKNELLEKIANGIVGVQTGDFPQFGKFYWEILPHKDWNFESTSFENIKFYNGKNFVIYWQDFKGILAERHKNGQSYVRGWSAFKKKGIIISPMNQLPVGIYDGELFDNNSAVIIPKDIINLTSIWCFCSSHYYNEEVRKIDQSLKVTNATLVQVPFDLDHWTQVAEEQYPHGLPEPFSNDPTQWIFHGHPCGSVVWSEASKKLEIPSNKRKDETVLQVAIARLLGYHWPAETDAEMELAVEQRQWVEACKTFDEFVDEDGIVAIPPIRGEERAVDRITRILARAYGEEWNTGVLETLLDSVGYGGKGLEDYLRNGFFAHHCKLFQHRPFIWQIWDGLPDGFSVLVNYHKLDSKNLETLIYTYLGDWINRQKQDKQAGIDGAEEKIAAAEILKKELESIHKGESPYDIFVRWKSLKDQPIGYNPDLNDGVRMNIRPFLKAKDIKKKDAGILRDKPNIKWDKDRGKDVESAPWYHKFGGDRINDHHTSLDEKRKARG